MNLNEIAGELNYAVRNYAGITKQIVQIRNRAHAYGINPDHEELIYGRKGKDGKLKMQGLESIKGMASRKIGRIIKDFPIWNEWLEHVPGIGPAIAGTLIRLYYYKSIPTCNKCGEDMPAKEKGKAWLCTGCNTDAKGMGIIKYRMQLREFPSISSWWHFMGRANDPVTGDIPKKKRGEQIDWNPDGKKLGFDFKESVNKFNSDHHYKKFAEMRKKYRTRTHPDATKGHRHNMAWNEAWKLFLSHFWQVEHVLSGSEMTEPWCVQHGGHDKSSMIPPYYFK